MATTVAADITTPEGRAKVLAACPDPDILVNIAQHFKNSPAGRPGNPFEFGEACAFLCAASSGFIVGQNLLLDGGAFNSTMG